MPTFQQDNEFRDSLISDTLLDDAISWITSNLAPNDVFRGDEITEWVKENFAPDDVFNLNKLDQWATENNYIKEE